MSSLSPVGEILRACRGWQGMSQLDLALTSGVSARHISFIETGRSQPSRDMVLRLGEALGVGLRQRNAMLVAAGFTPAYEERALNQPDLGIVRRAFQTILRNHEPYPAFVIDAAWNILMANQAHEFLLQSFLRTAPGSEATRNAVQLLLDPGLLKPKIRNWSVVAHVMGHRMQRMLRNLQGGHKAQLERLLEYPGVREAMNTLAVSPETEVVLPIEIELDGVVLSWFTTVATIGTPLDVTLDELRIESLLPADQVTEDAVLALVRETAAADGKPLA